MRPQIGPVHNFFCACEGARAVVVRVVAQARDARTFAPAFVAG
jgi:hypothetical protein